MLRAWLAWNAPGGGPDHHNDTMRTLFDLGDVLIKRGLARFDDGAPTPAGAALLARVEAAERPDPTAAIVAFLRAEETKFRKAIHETTRREVAERHTARASILATMAAYIERGDHLTTPIDAPPAKEPR